MTGAARWGCHRPKAGWRADQDHHHAAAGAAAAAARRRRPGGAGVGPGAAGRVCRRPTLQRRRRRRARPAGRPGLVGAPGGQVVTVCRDAVPPWWAGETAVCIGGGPSHGVDPGKRHVGAVPNQAHRGRQVAPVVQPDPVTHRRLDLCPGDALATGTRSRLSRPMISGSSSPSARRLKPCLGSATRRCRIARGATDALVDFGQGFGCPRATASQRPRQRDGESMYTRPQPAI